jgi:hypothetical protein
VAMPHVAVRVNEAKGCWVLDHVRIATPDSLGRGAEAVEGLWVWVLAEAWSFLFCFQFLGL